jgi:hypothetical protein
MKNTPFQRCKICGCSDDRACNTQLGPCFWVAEKLCSGCALQHPDPAHAAVFVQMLTKMAPELILQLHLWAVISLLIEKNILTQAEVSVGFLNQLRKIAEPITPSQIIIPSR